MLFFDNIKVGVLLENNRLVIQKKDNNINLTSSFGVIQTVFLIPPTNDIEIYVRSTNEEFKTVQNFIGKKITITGDYSLNDVILSKVNIETRSGSNGWTYWKGKIIQ